MSLPASLFAQGQNWGDLIWLIIVVLFIIVPALGQLLAKAGRPQRGGGRPVRRPPGAGGPPGQPPARGLEDEIGEFLRRAARQRQGPPAAAGRPGGRPVVARRVEEQPLEAEVVRQPAIGGQIERHVGKHLDAGEFRRRAGHLGEEVTRLDQQVEEQLHGKFDHEVGRLAGTPGEAAAAPGVEEPAEIWGQVVELPPTAAAGLAAMLSNPQNIRQAIVINEVLTRPEGRWTY